MSGDGVHLTLTRDQASSWELAATIVLRKWCRIERPALPQVGTAARKLREENKKHLEEEGSYAVPSLDRPAQADHRAFSKARSRVEIYLPPLISICPPPEIPASAAPVPGAEADQVAVPNPEAVPSLTDEDFPPLVDVNRIQRPVKKPAGAKEKPAPKGEKPGEFQMP